MKKVKPFKIIIKIIAIFVFLSVPFLIPRFIKIEKISCESQFGECSEKIADDLNQFSDNTFHESKKQTETYLKNNFLVSDYSVQYKAFNLMKVNIVLKKARFCLKNKDYDVYAFIDKNGNVLELKNICNLPTIYAQGKIPNVGENVGKDLLSALNLINQIFISYNIKEGNVLSDYLEISFPYGYKVIFPLDKDMEVLLGSLKLIINRLNTTESESRIIEDRINVIDLRYDNPVLR